MYDKQIQLEDPGQWSNLAVAQTFELRASEIKALANYFCFMVQSFTFANMDNYSYAQ